MNVFISTDFVRFSNTFLNLELAVLGLCLALSCVTDRVLIILCLIYSTVWGPEAILCPALNRQSQQKVKGLRFWVGL